MSNSVKKTYGLGKFWDIKQGKAEKGLEISTLAVVDVDVDYYTAYNVSMCKISPEYKESEARVHEYVHHFQKDCYVQSEDVRYIVIDACYAKQLIKLVIMEIG